MKCMKCKSLFLNNKNIIFKSIKLVFELEKFNLLFMIFVNILMAFIHLFGIIYTRRFFINLTNINYVSFFEYLNSIFISLIIYATYLFIVALKKIIYDRYYIQYIVIPNFEKKLKIKIQEKCSKIGLIEYEKDIINEKIHEVNFCSTNIFRLVEVIILYFGLILNLILISNYIIVLDYTYIIIIILTLFPLIMENYLKSKYITQYRSKLNLYERRSKEIEKCILENDYFSEIKIYNIFNFLIEKLKKTYSEHQVNFLKTNKKISHIELISKLFINIGMILIYFIAGYKYIKNNDIGNLIVVIVGINVISNFINEIFSLQGYMLMFSKLTQPYFDFMEFKFEIDESIKSDNIELKNISFKYPNSKVNSLSNINLQINKGETIAVVGENGSGKSTLAKILLGLYKPNSDFEYKLIDEKSVVFQDFCKYPLNIKENVELGSCSSKNSLEILKQMGFEENNYLKKLGKNLGGSDLSGGQWQKVAICRGIYKNSKFIVLDEPTAEIDPIFENEIYQIFKKNLLEKTGVIITHRLGSIKFADKILVLNKGKILAIGKHDELLKECDYYKEMWEAQKQNYFG